MVSDLHRDLGDKSQKAGLRLSLVMSGVTNRISKTTTILILCPVWRAAQLLQE